MDHPHLVPLFYSRDRHDAKFKGVGGATPALIAALAGSWHICRYLLEKGADPTVAMSSGVTIPYLANKANIDPDSKLGKDLAVVREIIAKKGLSRLDIPPREVEALLKKNQWPPKE